METEGRASVQYAGFWIRVLAACVDTVFLAAILLVVIGIGVGISVLLHVQLIGKTSGNDLFAMGTIILFLLIGMAVTLLYFPMMESSAWEGTFGKYILGLAVTDVNGNRVGFWRSVGRFLAKYLSQLILCIGFIMVAFTKKKQGLHDMIAGTLVIEKKPGKGLIPAFIIVILGFATIVGLSAAVGIAQAKAERAQQLIFSAKIGSIPDAERILSRSCDVNSRDNRGNTALHWASLDGHLELAKFLVERGSDIGSKNKRGETPLNEAALGGKTEIADFLLQKKADINAANVQGYTVLMEAIVNQHIDTAKFLIDKGPDLNKKDEFGETALLLAAVDGDTEIVKILLARHPDLNAKSSNGNTALSLARKHNHPEIVRMLVQAGAK